MTRLVSADTVIIDIDGRPVAVDNFTIAISGDTIVDLLPSSDAATRYPEAKRQHLDDTILMPGLINAHGHAAMTLLRGYSDDLALTEWLEQKIWPAERHWVNPDFVRDGTELAIAEMLLSGTTCFSDMYFFPETSAAVARDFGIRAQIASPIFDFATVSGNDADDYIGQTLALYDTYKNHPLISIAFGPHAPYTVGDASLTRIAALSNEIDAPVQLHLHETADEINTSLKQYGKRPIERIHQLGLLTARTQCVHMTQLSDTDLTLLRATGAHVVHCPQSNQKLASGASPIDQMQQQGINIAIGTDGAASNNSLNLFSELRAAALMAKLSSGRANSVSASDAITMATINGAKALGLSDICGSLAVGKKADIIAIDTATAAMQPMHNSLSQLAYSEPKVTNVWVAGKQLVRDGELTQVSLAAILDKAKRWKHTINEH